MLESVESIKVVVGVLFNEKKEVLVAQRQNHQFLAGFWEFPGGKIEPQETPQKALEREFYEEIGISIIQSTPLLQVDYDYKEKKVKLDVWYITRYEGIPRGCEGQIIRWVNMKELLGLSMPEANQSIILAVKRMMDINNL